MGWAGHVARKEMLTAFKTVARKAEAKKSLGRPKSRWDDNIKMDLRKRVSEGRLDSTGSR
jgi:transposase